MRGKLTLGSSQRRLLGKADIYAETGAMGRSQLCKVLKENFLSTGNNRCKGPKAGKGCNYVRNRKETRVAEADVARGL